MKKTAVLLLTLLAAAAQGGIGLDRWHYIQASNDLVYNYMGIAFGDVNGDNMIDIATGRFVCRNPGGNMDAEWSWCRLPVDCDANFITDVDGDDKADIIAQYQDKVYWCEATNTTGTAFTSKLVVSGFASAGHLSSQGWAMRDFIPGGKEEIIMICGSGLILITIPSNPDAGNWPYHVITSLPYDEGIAAADYDNDGLIDISASYNSYSNMAWWKNPGTAQGGWTQFEVGSKASNKIDRVAAADLDNDGWNDIVISETSNYATAGGTYGNGVHWFKNPGTSGTWIRSVVCSQQGAMNSMSIADIDQDGHMDVLTGEHRSDGPPETVVWKNTGNAAGWQKNLVDSGKEQHLGVQTCDLDKDGDLEIVSIGWTSPQYLHIWRNDNGPGNTGLARAAGESAGVIQAYPNPFKTNIRISVSRKLKVESRKFQIYSIQGKLLKTFNFQLSTFNFFTWDASAHPAGVYLLKSTGPGKTYTRKLFLMK